MTEGSKWFPQGAVSWVVYAWTVLIFTTIMGSLFYQHENIREALAAEKEARIQADIANNQVANEIKTSLAGIQADLKNLDARLLEIKSDIKSLK